MAYNGRRPWRNENLTIEAGDLIIRAKLVDVKYDQLGSHDVTHPLVGYAYLVKQAQHYEYEAHCTRLEALAKAIEDCKTKGYLDDYMDKEEFLTMLPNVYTIEQQLMDQLEYGIEQGIEQGIELGIEQERQKFVEERQKLVDEHQKLIAQKQESVRLLAAHGISAQLISQSLHLSLEEVEQAL